MKKPLRIESKLVRDSAGNPKRFTKKTAFNELRTHGDNRRVEIIDLGDYWHGIVQHQPG